MNDCRPPRPGFLARLGFSRAALPGGEFMFVVHSMDVEYLRPARLDDELEAGARVVAARGARLVFAQRVLRLRDGDAVELVAGAGMEADGVLRLIGRHEVHVRIGDRRTHPAPPSTLHLAVAPTKQAERFEWFVEKAVEHKVLIIPGNVFSSRDTHFRLSFSAKPEQLAQGLAILRSLMTA